ncbi:MAG: hypothetical protein LBU74_06230 [Methanobacteriaceae archaeon]|jgi:hypothetical protein|nr:hypothetical protein [Candidatus Methanorudis spinitermitis]
MINKKKVIIFLTLFSCFFILISSASAANYYVNNGTTQKNIVDWMKNNATNGDSLIFNVGSYNLTDTLNITKSITIKSDVNTKISFSKNKDMFDVKTSGITFSGLNLDYNGEGSTKTMYGAISTLNASKSTTKQFTVSNTVINVNKKYTVGILLGTMQGSIINSNINIKGANCFGISLTKWTGDLINTTIKSTGKDSICVYSGTWNGKVNGSKINNDGSNKNFYTGGFLAVNSKGIIVNSEIKSKNSYAVMASDNVNVTNSTLSSKKGLAKIYRYRPDLVVYNQIGLKKNTYSFRVYNIGEVNSKACTFLLKTSTITKKANVKALKPGQYTTIKITLASKYVGKKYTKTMKVDSTNVNKENNKKNNVGKFKF